MRRTKIICTLGPACRDEATLTDMLQNGMNVARFNFSHGDHAYHKDMMDTFRTVRDRLGVPAAIMLDTKGPEIRLGILKTGKAMLQDGQTFTLTTKNITGDSTAASVSYRELPRQLKTGDTLLIDDGKISLTVASCTETDIVCTVVHGGELKDKKGLNIPDVSLDMPFLSEQDKKDLLFGIEQKVDYIAASFTRSRDDIVAMRKFIDYNGGHSIRIIAKIESIEGVKNFDEILKVADGIMIARGDMGVELEYDMLPGIQKKCIHKCCRAGKIVITATQMLESMIHSATPTRAEITDVANAVFDGTSAVMLSGESAAGDHPALVVQVMAKILARAEQDMFDINQGIQARYDNDESDITNAICDAACTTARDVHATAIIAVTAQGTTARRVSKFHPYERIIASTPDMKTFHQLSLSWGVYPVLALMQDNTDDLFLHAIDCAKQFDLVSPGDRVVITAGIPLKQAGTTNILKVQVVE